LYDDVMIDALRLFIVPFWSAPAKPDEPPRLSVPDRRVHDVHVSPAADTDLLARVRAGDPTAFDHLYLTQYADLHRFAWRMMRSSERAEDVVHDVFAIVWARRATLDVQSSLRGYLFGLVRNRAVALIRHARVVERTAARAGHDDHALAHSAPHEQVDREIEHAELDAELRRLAQSLPSQRREVLLLRWEFQMSYPEIAQTLGISHEAARAHGSRAGRVLRAALERFLIR
jgi:RNA polymerase sigma-70 factor (family 1)